MKTASKALNISGLGGDRSDWWIAAFCMVLGSAGLRAVGDPVLWNELLRRSGPQTTQPMGEVMRKGGGVRFRSQGSPLWHDVAERSEAVSAGDTIFTGEDGHAELKLADGGSVEIMPGSLVVVRRSGDELESSASGWLKGAFGSFLVGTTKTSMLNVEKGSARVQLKKGAEGVKLQAGGKVYQLTSQSDLASAEISIDVGAAGQGGAPMVRINSDSAGKIEIQTGLSAPMQIESGSEVVASAEDGGGIRIQAVHASPVSPEGGSALYLEPGKAVAFSWRWDAGSTNQAEERVEVQIDGAEKRNIKVNGASQAASAVLPQGTYQWRLVQGEGAKRTETPWRGFNVTSFSFPRKTGPLEGAVVRVPDGAQEAVVDLNWAALQSGVLAEYSLDGAIKQQGKTLHEGHRLRLAPGNYTWRVRSVLPGGRESSWSEATSFSVITFTASASATSGAAIGSPLMVQAPVVPPVKATVVAPAPVAVRQKAKVIAETKAPVLPPAPVMTISTASGTTRMSNSGRLDELVIPLEWKALPHAQSYEVVILSASGKTLSTKTTTAPSWSWVLKSLVETRFKYQVTAVLADGSRVASAPVPLEIQLSAPLLRTPEDSKPMKSASLDAVIFTWERTMMTQEYEFQISANASFQDDAAKIQKSARNFMSVAKLQAGTYFWRVRSVANGNKSQWSAVSKLILKE